jgi:flagellar basal body-associated protein FliL
VNLTQRSTTNLVVLVLGVALVVFFAGVSAVLAVTGSAPAEMWAAGAAISGALVGVLVPPPNREAAAQLGASTTINELSASAVQAAQEVAEQKVGSDKDAAQEAVQLVQNVTGRIKAVAPTQAANVDPGKAPEVAATNTVETLKALRTGGASGTPQADVFSAVVDATTQEQANATDKGAQAADAAGGTGKLTGIMLVLLALLLGLLAVGVGLSFIHSDGDQVIREADKTVLALASSAGGALIGVLAPPSSSG